MTAVEGIQLSAVMTDDEDLTIHRGTGCLWTDLGYPNSAEMATKSRLAALISDILRDQGWSPVAAAVVTGLPEDVFAYAQRGRLGDISVGDLIEALTRLGCDILITIGAPENERGAVLVQGPDDD